MSKFYQDYYWKGGVPYGVKPVSPDEAGYKIVADPYRKWICVEQYEGLKFIKVVYDSKFLDFRKLNPSEQTGWERTIVSENNDRTVSSLRNQDDRLVFMETIQIKNQRCQECRIHSPHGILLSIHRMSYQEEGAPFDGVTLFDSNQHPVMIKKYEIDPISGEFNELIEEIWAFEHIKIEFNLKTDYNVLFK